MKSLDHSKIYYKGLGQRNEEECRKVLRKEYRWVGLLCAVAVFYIVVIWCCLTDPDFDKLDCLIMGICSGLLLSLILDLRTYIIRNRLRLKEIKEGEE